jgi:hypothetical protein
VRHRAHHHVEADAVRRSTMQTMTNDAVMQLQGQSRRLDHSGTKVSAAGQLMTEGGGGERALRARAYPSAPHRSLYFVHVMQ